MGDMRNLIFCCAAKTAFLNKLSAIINNDFLNFLLTLRVPLTTFVVDRCKTDSMVMIERGCGLNHRCISEHFR